MHALKTTIRTKRLAAAALATSALLGQATLTLPAEAASRDLYLSSESTDEILRYDGDDGSFEGAVASGGRLNSPYKMTFGPEEDLYVANESNDEVLRAGSGDPAIPPPRALRSCCINPSPAGGEAG